MTHRSRDGSGDSSGGRRHRKLHRQRRQKDLQPAPPCPVAEDPLHCHDVDLRDRLPLHKSRREDPNAHAWRQDYDIRRDHDMRREMDLRRELDMRRRPDIRRESGAHHRRPDHDVGQPEYDAEHFVRQPEHDAGHYVRQPEHGEQHHYRPPEHGVQHHFWHPEEYDVHHGHYDRHPGYKHYSGPPKCDEQNNMYIEPVYQGQHNMHVPLYGARQEHDLRLDLDMRGKSRGYWALCKAGDDAVPPMDSPYGDHGFDPRLYRPPESLPPERHDEAAWFAPRRASAAVWFKCSSPGGDPRDPAQPSSAQHDPDLRDALEYKRKSAGSTEDEEDLRNALEKKRSVRHDAQDRLNTSDPVLDEVAHGLEELMYAEEMNEREAPHSFIYVNTALFPNRKRAKDFWSPPRTPRLDEPSDLFTNRLSPVLAQSESQQDEDAANEWSDVDSHDGGRVTPTRVEAFLAEMRFNFEQSQVLAFEEGDGPRKPFNSKVEEAEDESGDEDEELPRSHHRRRNRDKATLGRFVSALRRVKEEPRALDNEPVGQDFPAPDLVKREPDEGYTEPPQPGPVCRSSVCSLHETDAFWKDLDLSPARSIDAAQNTGRRRRYCSTASTSVYFFGTELGTGQATKANGGLREAESSPNVSEIADDRLASLMCEAELYGDLFESDETSPAIAESSAAIPEASPLVTEHVVSEGAVLINNRCRSESLSSVSSDALVIVEQEEEASSVAEDCGPSVGNIQSEQNECQEVDKDTMCEGEEKELKDQSYARNIKKQQSRKRPLEFASPPKTRARRKKVESLSEDNQPSNRKKSTPAPKAKSQQQVKGKKARAKRTLTKRVVKTKLPKPKPPQKQKKKITRRK